MNKEETKEAIKVMQAFVDGKAIEYNSILDVKGWKDTSSPEWHFGACQYRIKPETPKNTREPFSLDTYLKNPCRRVETRDGRNARIISTNRKNSNFPIIALILSSTGYEDLVEYTSTGSLHTGIECCFDLFFADSKLKGDIYRPYANAKEFFTDVKKHGGWIIGANNQYRQIEGINFGCTPNIVKISSCSWMKFEELLDAVWADDGTPCGVKEE